MKRPLHFALPALLLLLAPLSARAQASPVLDTLQARFNTYSTWCSPEKVYLHYDRSCYTAGETIWFKGWIQESSRISGLPPSNFLYVEVLDERGEAAVRVKIKRQQDGFPGCIELPDRLETGNYTLRAYTLWQLNSDPEYFFNDRLRIIGAGRPTDKKKLAEVPSADVDISFWPEGGRYFIGQKSVMGFKVVDKQGKSVEFKGILVSDLDGLGKHIYTGHDGMGSFSFIPQPGHKYSIQDAGGKLHPLPAASEEGATLQLRTYGGRYYISVLGMGGEQASLLVRDVSELYPLAQVHLDGHMSTLMLEKNFFRPGINHFLLVNAKGKILAERLFFVRDEKAPVCQLEMTRFEPVRRVLSQGVITLSAPDGTPLDGSCSVSVVRGTLKDWQQSDGITSYLGLSSELKGHINDPYYYFDPDIPEQERDAALDNLMMIQGWRYYDLDKITDIRSGNFQISHIRELMQEVRGRISRMVATKKMPKKYTFTFMIPKWNVLHSVKIEEGRSFVIDSLDFPENTEMLIKISSSRLGARYLPRWNGDLSAPSYLYTPAPGIAKDARIMAPLLEGDNSDYTLDAAVVTAAEEDDDVLIFGTSFRNDLVAYKELTLVEYLSMKKAMFEYDGENMYNRNQRRFGVFSDPLSTDDSGMDDTETGLVKLIVGDTEEAWWTYDMLRLGDLRTLTVSTQPDPIYGGDGGVVHITVKPGGMRQSSERNPTLLYFVPLGHQKPRTFASPRYDKGEDGPYDKRNTLWWSPELKLNGGQAQFEFCNNDLQDFPYIIRIEGISADGRPFSRHCSVTPENFVDLKSR